MGQRRVRVHTLVLQLVEGIDAVRHHLLLYLGEVVAGNHCLEFHAELVGELAALGEQLEADVGHAAILIFEVYYDVVGVLCHVFIRWCGWL